MILAGKKYLSYTFNISNNLYLKRIKNQIIDYFNIKKSLKYANKVKAKIAIIIGEYEFNNSLVSYKNLESGEQFYIDQKELFKKLKYE